MEDSHADAYFESGQTIRLEASASVPEATVLGIFEEEGELLYKLEWTTGTVNEQPVGEMDEKAINRTRR
jgi:hypothetical protein